MGLSRASTTRPRRQGLTGMSTIWPVRLTVSSSLMSEWTRALQASKEDDVSLIGQIAVFSWFLLLFSRRRCRRRGQTIDELVPGRIEAERHEAGKGWDVDVGWARRDRPGALVCLWLFLPAVRRATRPNSSVGAGSGEERGMTVSLFT
jgi:hypothetical protein